MSFLSDIEVVGKKIEGAFVWLYQEAKDEVPAVLGALVKIYGPEVIATAIASHQAGVQDYLDKGIDTASADTQALVQSTLVAKFGNSGLANTAAQFIASGIKHLFTIGESDVNALIAKGAAGAIAATGAVPTDQPPAA